MPGESPELRPLTVWERGFTAIYGGIPSSFMLFVLRAIFLFLSGPDVSVWHFVRYTFGFDAGLDMHVDAIDTYYVPYVMANGMYGVFYFTWGRSLGHMAAGAHIVDARTGRRMRTWQKAVRSVLQLVNGYIEFLRILDVLSIFSVLIDRERRRSIYDMIAGTMVVVGNPVEEEPEAARQRSWLSALFGQLTGREPAG
ncbi:MAG: RDD family protein [Chloroflexota bacterium]|nr:RDD family protein [Chloroflexota bacterium]MDE2961569.1 RDD family protein [Chloroflexota bacterium]